MHTNARNRWALMQTRNTNNDIASCSVGYMDIVFWRQTWKWHCVCVWYARMPYMIIVRILVSRQATDYTPHSSILPRMVLYGCRAMLDKGLGGAAYQNIYITHTWSELTTHLHAISLIIPFKKWPAYLWVAKYACVYVFCAPPPQIANICMVVRTTRTESERKQSVCWRCKWFWHSVATLCAIHAHVDSLCDRVMQVLALGRTY